MTTYKKTTSLRLAIVLCISLLSGCGGSEQRQTKYFERAQSFFDNENYEKATIEVKNVLQINPNHADARYLMGMIAEKNNDYRAAFGNFNAAVDVDPAHIKSLNKLANYYLLSKKSQNALEMIEAAMAIDATNADTLAAFSMYHFNEKQTEKAIEYARTALSESPGHVQATTVLTAIYAEDDPDAALNIIADGISQQSSNESLRMLKIRVLESQNKLDEVIAQYKELMQQHPDNLFYPYQLVNVYLKDEQTEKQIRENLAETVLRDLVDKKPENEQVKLWLVEFLIRNRGHDQGRQELEKFVQKAPDSFLLRDALAKIYVGAGQSPKAVDLYTYVIDSDPKSALSIDARNRLITLALSEKRRDDADKLLVEVFDIEPENTDALITRAKLKMLNNDIDGAIPDLRVVIKNAPDSNQALLLLAKAHEQNQSKGLALDNYRRLIALQPKNIEALTGAARILMAQDQRDEAIAYLETALTVNAINPQASLLLVNGYINNRQWEQAVTVAEQLLEHDNTKAMGHYLKGRIYLRKQQIAPAISSLKTALDIDPRIIEALTALVQGYLAEDKTDEALSYVLAHVSKHPEQAHARELLASLYARSGDGVKAITEIQLLIDRQPERISAYRILAQIYANENNPDAVEQVYKSGLEKKPDNITLKILLAEFYQTKEMYQQAVEIYESVLLDKPDVLVAKNNLASLLMDYFNNQSTIERVADLIDELETSDNPAFLDTAGWAHFHMGNYPQSIALLTAAIEKGATAAVYHYHLGMAYFKSGMKEQAKKHLHLATADDSQHYAGRNNALEVLDKL